MLEYEVPSPPLPQVYVTVCPLKISTGTLILQGFDFVFDSHPWQWNEKHIWQKLLRCLATDLLYWILEGKQYFRASLYTTEQ